MRVLVAIMLSMVLAAQSAAGYVKVETVKGNKVFVMYDQITGNPQDYTILFKALRNAKRGDTINISLREHRGGRMDVFTKLKRAILSSKARVAIFIENRVASASTLIAFYGDVLVVPYNSSLMYHAGSFTARINPNGKTIWRTTHRLTFSPIGQYSFMGMRMEYMNIKYQQVLTRKELRTWDRGADVYISGKRLCTNKTFKHPDVYKQIKGHCLIRGIKSTLGR